MKDLAHPGNPWMETFLILLATAVMMSPALGRAQTAAPTPPHASPVAVTPHATLVVPTPNTPMAPAPPAPGAGFTPASAPAGNMMGAAEAPVATGIAVVTAAPAAALPGAAPVLAPTIAQAPLQTVSHTLDQVRLQAAHDQSDDSLSKLRQEAAGAQASADHLSAAEAKELGGLDARLKRLSTSKGAPRPHLDPAQLKERAALLARRGELTGQIKAAQQEGAAASETYNDISNRRRSAFDARVFQRTASPLEAGFWTSLLASIQPDAERLGQLFDSALSTVTSASEPKGALSIAVALALALLLLLPVRRTLRRFSQRRFAAAASTDGFSRSAYAVGAVLIDTALPGAAAIIVDLGLTWGDLVSDKVEAVVRALVIAVFWGAAVVALTRQLAGSSKNRLLPVSERLAARMRALPWLVALITGSGFLLSQINKVVGASLAATIAANCVISLAYAGVASLVLLALSGDSDAETAAEEAGKPGRALLSLVLSAAILVTVGAVFAGFTTFAALVSNQIFWVSTLVALTYLVLRFTDDAVAELFKPQGWVGRMFIAILNLRVSVVDQLGVLTSALLQILIVLGALSLGLTPFGRSGDLLSAHVGHLGEVVHLGSVTISPRSVGAALASLLVGLGLVHLVERWANRRFLPVTDWDVGVRNSVATGVRYLGVGATVLWALAAAGLGFKQIALVASALSVGIGFGLQIVQNFVSGLILLVERPVKVGDWVNVGGVEGDVKRIRVRATEIQTFDRTTLIVPNSDLITKSVQNKTLGDPRGRVQLQLTIGAAADAARAIGVIEGVLKADADVLDDPKPNVFIDSLTDGGSVKFNCFAYVASPRDAYGVRSRLYGELITGLADAKIGFVGGPSMVIMEPGPDLKALIDEVAAKREAGASAPSSESKGAQGGS